MKFIRGKLAEKIYNKVKSVEEDDNDKIVGFIESLDGLKIYRLGNDENGYSSLLVNEDGQIVFLWNTPFALYLVDVEKIWRDKALTQAYVYFTSSYFRNREKGGDE